MKLSRVFRVLLIICMWDLLGIFQRGIVRYTLVVDDFEGDYVQPFDLAQARSL